MKDNKISITISKPIAEVFEFTINPRNTSLWIRHLKKEEASEYPPKIGTTYRNSVDLVSWDEYEVTDFEDNKIFELTSKDGIYHVKYTYTENEDGSTNMEYFEWVDEGELSNPFTQPILGLLKQILESNPSGSAIHRDNPIWGQFDLDNNLIKEYKYWMLLVRKKNVKLGSCVAILKRDAFPLSEVTPEEMAEYALLTREVETAIKKAFNPHLIHHLALMFIDKQIHFHIIPRYTEPMAFAGLNWEDDNIPDPLIQKRDELPQDVLKQIRDVIKSNLD